MNAYRLRPVDSWFFRDGTPFATDAGTQMDVGGPFPPAPSALAGAVRAALALLNGWSGSRSWNGKLKEVLGDGPDDLGKLDVTGPILLYNRGASKRSKENKSERDQENGQAGFRGEALWPVPLHLVAGVREHSDCESEQEEHSPPDPLGFFLPKQEYLCEAGRLRLPQMPRRSEHSGDRPKPPGSHWWITSDGLAKILQGKLPEPKHFVHKDSLWKKELRIGIQRDNARRRVIEGMLYAARHVRLRPGVEVGVLVNWRDGAPQNFDLPQAGYVSPVGGESRLGEWESWPEAADALQLSVPIDEPCAAGRFILIALTPVALCQEVFLGKQPLPGLPGTRVVSACADRPQRIGGWNSLERKPLPLRSYLAPGTVLFCTVDGQANELEQALRQKAVGNTTLFKIGDRTQAGFGLVALGLWPENSGGGNT